jgi:hypothetical protein
MNTNNSEKQAFQLMKEMLANIPDVLLRNLEAQHTDALAYVFEETYRAWRLCLAGSGQCFRRGQQSVYQTLLSKLDDTGAARLLLSREDSYRPNESPIICGRAKPSRQIYPGISSSSHRLSTFQAKCFGLAADKNRH